jgi:very-short-patch-repair endonuclease
MSGVARSGRTLWISIGRAATASRSWDGDGSPRVRSRTRWPSDTDGPGHAETCRRPAARTRHPAAVPRGWHHVPGGAPSARHRTVDPRAPWGVSHGSRPRGWWWQATSALLSVGSGAAWAFGTAQFAHGLMRTAPTTVELVVDAAIHVRPGLGIRVHRSRYADQRVDELHWPWRTRFEETVLDLAERGSTDEVLALLGRAFFRGQTTEATLRSLLENRARHRRRRLLTDVLADVADGAQSAMEVRFLQDVERAHGLPRGRRQAPSVAGRLRLHDVAYDEQRVLVELDGRLGHVGEGRISDGRRDRRSAGQGWLTLRAFWIDVAGTPARQLARWPRS